MNLFHRLRGIGLLSVATAIIVLVGCGGDGEGGASTTGSTSGDQARQQLDNGNFESSLTGDPAGATSMNLKLDDSTGTQLGEAIFEQDATLAPVSRGLLTGNINFFGKVSDWNPQFNSTFSGGTLTFKVKDFSIGSPYTVLNFNGTFTIEGAIGANAKFTISGTITGTNRQGQPVNLNATFTEKSATEVADFRGSWFGKIQVGELLRSYTVTFTQGAQPLKLTAAVKAGTSQFSFPAGQAGITLAGEFDGAALGFQGKTGLWYIKSDSATTFAGQYLIVNSAGAIEAHGTITGEKGTPPLLETGQYGGSLTVAGQDSSEFKYEIANFSATAGANGAFIINPNGGQMSAGTLSTFSASGSTVTITTSGLQGDYTSITFTGTATISMREYNGTFTATKKSGGTVSGTFSSFKGENTRAQMSGVYKGSLNGVVGQVTVNAQQDGNSIAWEVHHLINGQAGEYVVFGYVVGDLFTLYGDSLVTPSGSIQAYFEGSAVGTLVGEGRLTGQVTGGNPINANGSFSFTKQ